MVRAERFFVRQIVDGEAVGGDGAILNLRIAGEDRPALEAVPKTRHTLGEGSKHAKFIGTDLNEAAIGMCERARSDFAQKKSQKHEKKVELGY